MKVFKCFQKKTTLLIDMSIEKLEKKNLGLILDDLISEIESKSNCSYQIACDLYIWSKRIYQHNVLLEPFAKVSYIIFSNIRLFF